jgi:hypothetical protein
MEPLDGVADLDLVDDFEDLLGLVLDLLFG